MMRTVKLLAIFTFSVCALLFNGCNSEMQDLRIQNNTQQKLIDQLQAELEANKLRLEQMKKQLAAAQQTDSIEVESLQQQIAALEEDLAKKKELIASMQQRLLMGGAALPVELSTLLEDFAKQHDMVTYDSSRGIVKFKSDLLFDKGSDNVAASAIEAVQSLTAILNSEQGKKFDVIIAGHTDDIPIQKPETRAKHPTNWHLSSHRAIAVLKVMESNNIESNRLSARGFGEYRPIAENKPGKKGNPQNRRVEIYIVAEGV
ncbi:MAG: OmpA family protein [Planctomycetota bacterium]|jgi:chemotaxis protein MotB